MGEKGSHRSLSDFTEILVFRTDCWKRMGGNTQTSQEAFAVSQARVMVARTRVVAVEVMR